MSAEIQELEIQIAELTARLTKLRLAASEDLPDVPNYTFATSTGSTDLASLFCGKDLLFAIHNMGQACRYCTLWADGAERISASSGGSVCSRPALQRFT